MRCEGQQEQEWQKRVCSQTTNGRTCVRWETADIVGTRKERGTTDCRAVPSVTVDVCSQPRRCKLVCLVIQSFTIQIGYLSLVLNCNRHACSCPGHIISHTSHWSYRYRSLVSGLLIRRWLCNTCQFHIGAGARQADHTHALDHVVNSQVTLHLQCEKSCLNPAPAIRLLARDYWNRLPNLFYSGRSKSCFGELPWSVSACRKQKNNFNALTLGRSSKFRTISSRAS